MTDTVSPASDPHSRKKKSLGRIVTAVVRVLLGVMFLFFGVVGLLNLIKPPANTPPEVIAIMDALANAGFMKVVAVTEIIVGLMLLTNRFVPLALALLAPIVVGIITYHVAMDLKTIVPGVVVLMMEVYLAWSYRGAFRPMLRAKVAPDA